MTNNKIIRLNTNPEGLQDQTDELEQDMFESDIPVQHTHSYYEDENQQAHTFESGAALFIPEPTLCTCQLSGNLRLLYTVIK